MEVLAIIPARGGSKGIPAKNLRPVGGVPLVARAVAAAKGARLVTRVAVSTDDREIARVAREAGAEIIDRPGALAGDEASSESALLHALEHLGNKQSYRPDLVVFVQCTSPFVSSEDIDGAIQTLRTSGADSVLSAAPFHGFLWRRDAAGAAAEVDHDRHRRPRRQEREPRLLETGAVYVMRAEGFRQAKHRFFGRTVLHEVPAIRAIEIDEPPDLAAANALAGGVEEPRTNGTSGVFRNPEASGEVRAALPQPVAALVLDFDGVFTDNRVFVSESGEETVACNRSDGLGLEMLRKSGLPMVVLSTEPNPVVTARCRKLGIACVQGLADKGAALDTWLREREIDPAHTVYVGNDINDLECLKRVGCGIVVADAHPAARVAARATLRRPGGHGAVREVCDLILEQRGR